MSIKESYDISVIVPVYNAEKYLQDCIDSLLNQTKKDVEIILVNDGSTDKSHDIIVKNQKKHSNITVVEQENKGVCIARNAGLSIAKGKYIGWLDADDMLKPTALETLYKMIIDNDADYAYYNICFYPKNVRTKKPWFKEYKGVRDWNFIERNSQCTNSLTAKKLLEEINIKYWFSKYNEYGWIAVLLFAKKIVYSTEKLYVYRVGHNSASGGSYAGKVPKFQKAVELTKLLPEMIKDTVYEKNLGRYFEYRYIYTLLLLMIVSAINSDKLVYKQSKCELKKIKYKQNSYTKLILDNNHGKLKSFVLRNFIPLNYALAKIITLVVF